MGSEALGVVQLGILTDWYGKATGTLSLGLACALALTITRLGTLAAFDVLAVVAERHGIHSAFWVVVVLLCFEHALDYDGHGACAYSHTSSWP